MRAGVLRMPTSVRAIPAMLMLLMAAAGVGCLDSSVEVEGIREAVDPTPELRYIHNPEAQEPISTSVWTPMLEAPPADATEGSTYTSVSVGSNHMCAIRTDGVVACLGDNDFGQATPPEGMFTSVSAGDQHSCGVRTDGGVACWGTNVLTPSWGIMGPPP